jgi:hypothetical protein
MIFFYKVCYSGFILNNYTVTKFNHYRFAYRYVSKFVFHMLIKFMVVNKNFGLITLHKSGIFIFGTICP